ncbi:hypothetical protein [Streptomyces sp. PTD5-9]|uniref:hypothetical protein n=1 Tax=Streptomyces sp. PTD5-9 TaxID=3120150 RepID=UPI00300A7D71
MPDDRFGPCVAAARDVLETVRPLESLRTDPESRCAHGRRLLFAAFRGLPLFWRVDLEIRGDDTDEHGDDPGERSDVPGERGDDWSRPASALANAVAAAKAVLRDQPLTARGLLERGFRRVGAPDEVTGLWDHDIGRLAEAAAARDPGLRPLADRVVLLVRNRLGDAGAAAVRPPHDRDRGAGRKR